MAKNAPEPSPSNPWNLKDPAFAAFLAWLVPGLGHAYQRRFTKAGIFSTSILLIYVYGLVVLGDGRVVYASMRPQDRRWPFLCQAGVGLPVLPALIQASRVKSDKAPLWNGFMAPPQVAGPHEPSELHDLHHELGRRFELGTVYTMVAGLLNMLVIYDALIGPAYADPRERKRPGRDAGETRAGKLAPGGT